MVYRWSVFQLKVIEVLIQLGDSQLRAQQALRDDQCRNVKYESHQLVTA